MSSKSKTQDWSKPAAMAIPKGGYFQDKLEQGRYGPIFPKTPACYGFSILAKIIPGREDVFYKYAKSIEETIAAQPDALAVLQLHYLRWVLFPIKGNTYFMYQGIFDTDFDKYTEDAVTLFGITGLRTVFENLEDFPMDWRTNAAAFIKFVRDHQCPSFLEYAEYPYASATEIKKALKLKARSRPCSIRCNDCGGSDRRIGRRNAQLKSPSARSTKRGAPDARIRRHSAHPVDARPGARG